MDVGSPAWEHADAERARADEARRVKYPPDAEHCAGELVSIIAYLTSTDGPLQTAASTPSLTPWHATLLGKAYERLEVVDAYMRARVAFLVAGKDHGYYTPAAELDLAGATLDAERATGTVVRALLEGRLPSGGEYEVMSRTALRIHPALEALQASRTSSEGADEGAASEPHHG